MDPLKKAIEECKDLTPNSVSPDWLPDGTGFRSGDKEPSWTTTDTEDREIVWTHIPTRQMYLVVDEGNTYKPYIDRYFLFADPIEAIEKVHALLTLPDDTEPLELKAMYGNLAINDLTPDILKPGVRYLFKRDMLEVIILAVPLTGYNVGDFKVKQ
jgi:hypothetical protein